jgi:putative colanic acid biosynthesis acetyltransferase WcaF
MTFYPPDLEPEADFQELATRPAVDFSRFDNRRFDRGAPALRELAWILTRSAVFEHGHVGLETIRRQALIRFGAKIGHGGTFRRGLRITFPWKLEVGDYTWLGEDAWLLNLAPIRIGKNVSISQRAFLCTGNHDWSDQAFSLITAPITVEDGAWIGAASFVGPGVTIGTHAIVTAGSVVNRDLPPYTICSGNPCRPVRERRIRP